MSVTYSASPALVVGRLAKCIAMAKGDASSALGYAEGQRYTWGNTPSVFNHAKAAVNALATGDAGALAAARNLSELLGLVRQQTIVDRLSLARRVPPNVAMPSVVTDLSTFSPGEGAAKGLSKFSIATVTVDPKKISAAFVVSNDLVKLSNIDVETDLGVQAVRALSLRLDRVFADRTFPNSISNGATSIASTGITLAAFDNDLRALVALFSTHDASQLIFAMSSNLAVYLGSLRGSGGAPAFPNVGRNGGSIWQVPVLVSAALTASGSPGESEILLIDQSEIVIADQSEAEIRIAKSASVQLVDNPTSPATTTTSLFQSNLMAVLVERWIGWGRVNTSSVAVLTDIQVG